MNVYVGQTRSKKLISALSALGFGECTNRGELPPRRVPWFMDNGAFSDWKAGQEFDGDAFQSDLDRCLGDDMVKPDFIVCPDIVGGGTASLTRSGEWFGRVERAGARVYLAVQDGMAEKDVLRHLDDHSYSGLFIGGTLDWKLAHGEEWVMVGKEAGFRVHIGRVGTAPRVLWARRIGADSIDSSLPLWSKDNLRRFVAAIEAPLNGELFE